MTALKPGERKILETLNTGEKRFKDLNQTCIKNPTILAAYLKHLQKTGLIWRNIDTRGFQLQVPGWESLLLSDITSLIENYGLRKENRKLLGLDVILSENDKALQHIIEAIHGEPRHSQETLRSFSKIDQFLFRDWKNQVLAFFSERDRQMIEEYEQAFHDAVLLTIPPKERVSKASSRSLAEKKLKRRYPGIKIPAAMVELEAATIFKKMTENETRAMILEIGNAKKLLERLHNLSHLTDEDKARLKPLIECLSEVKKINVHNRYLKSLGSCPKTLIIFSSLAFEGYLKKQWDLFPNEERAFKEKHPWLHNEIKQLH